MSLNRVSSSGTASAQVDDVSAPSGPPPKLSNVAPKQNEVVHLPTGIDSSDERFEVELREQIGRLDANESLELSLTGKAKVKPVFDASGEASGKVSIKKDSGGGLSVSMEGEGAVGDVDGKNVVGLGGSVKYHCENKDQAADLARALFTSSALEAGSVTNPLVNAGRQVGLLLNPDSQTLRSSERVAAYAPGLKEVRVDVLDRASLSSEKKSVDLGFTRVLLGKSDIKLEGRGSITVDLAKNEVRQTVALASSQKTAVFTPAVIATELSAKETVSLTLTYRLTPELAKKLAEGKLSQTEALATAMAGAPAAISAKGEVEVAGKGRMSNAADSKLKLSAEVKLDTAAFTNGDATNAVMQALADTKWTATQETGVGYSMGFDAVVASGEYRTTHRKTTTVTEPTSLEAAWTVVKKHVKDLDANDLDALRAASLLGEH